MNHLTTSISRNPLRTPPYPVVVGLAYAKDDQLYQPISYFQEALKIKPDLGRGRYNPDMAETQENCIGLP